MASGAHLSRELFDLVKSIGESRSKQEEDRIIAAEKTSLKTKISEPGLAAKKMKELLIRAIYCEMLGHSADFAHIHAVNFTHQRTLLNKRIGYLASSLFLDCNNSLVVLMVATIQSDLQSSNDLIISSALTALIRIVDTSIIQAVIEPVQKLLVHNNENVRKKAVYAMQRFYELEASYVGEEAMYAKMKKALCDRDPSVMVATLPYFKREMAKYPTRFKDLISSFVVILKQVVEHKLPKEFEYHRMPAPWIQLKILEILAILGKDDQQSSQNMYEVVSMVLRRADSLANNIGHAVVYQCVKTLVTIYPSQLLLDTSDLNISRFISAESRNLRYIGIDALTLIVRINPKYTLQYQDIVVDCLQDPDDTLKSKTLDLLYRMTNKQNVDFIIDKMLGYLRVAPPESKVRQGLVTKVCNLAEAYSKNKAAYIRTMNRVFETAADLMNRELLSKVIKLVAQWHKEATDSAKFTDYTVSMYMSILQGSQVLPDSLLQLIAWVVGEFVTDRDPEKAKKCILLLCQVMNRPVVKQETLGWVLHALAKLHFALGFQAPSTSPGDAALVELERVFKNYSRSRSLELQQRSLEYAAMKKQYQLRAARLPSLKDSIFQSNEVTSAAPKKESEKKVVSTNLLLADDFQVEIQNKELEIAGAEDAIDDQLAFLDVYVQRAIDNGAKEYRRGPGSQMGGNDERTEGSQLMAGVGRMRTPSLKFTEYQAPQRQKHKPPQQTYNSYMGGGGQNGSGLGTQESLSGGGGVAEGLRVPAGRGLQNSRPKWTSEGHVDQLKAGGITKEQPKYAQSDLNKMATLQEKSQASFPSRRNEPAPREEKKVKTAAQLFSGVQEKEEDDGYDDYEVEQKQPTKPPASEEPSLLELENAMPSAPPQGSNLLGIEEPNPLEQALSTPSGGLTGLAGLGIAPSQPVPPPSVPPVQSAPPITSPSDPFGELASLAGGGSLLGAPTTQESNLLMMDTPAPASGGGGFQFTSAPAATGPPSMTAGNFSNYALTTEQFGVKWVGCGNEKKLSLLSLKVRDPQTFLSCCGGINFKPIQIIHKEAIAAALYKGMHQCFIHGSIEPSGMITAQLRSASDEALQVASFLLNQKLS